VSVYAVAVAVRREREKEQREKERETSVCDGTMVGFCCFVFCCFMFFVTAQGQRSTNFVAFSVCLPVLAG
jgi:cytidylate kinase